MALVYALRVAVIGAGPAGSTLAYRLAERGVEVDVYEALEKPRGICGGGIGWSALEYMRRYNPAVQDAVERSAMERVRRASLCVSRAGELLGCVELEGELGYVVDRREFDYYLAREAERAGARIYWRTRARPADLLPRYDYVVDAGGFTSWGRSGGRRPELVVLEQYWAPRRSECLSIIFDSSIHRGYVWVFPAGSLDKIGFGESPEYYAENKGVLRDIAARLSGWQYFDLLSSLAARRDYAALPLYTPRAARFYRGGVFYAGTAAGLVDPLTGAGIKYAVASGSILADAISGGGPKSLVRTRYTANLYVKVVRELAMLRRARTRVMGLVRANPEGALEMMKLLKRYLESKRGRLSIVSAARLAIKVLG